VVQGVDLRPATGALYALTTTALDAARIRVLDAGTGALSSPLALAADPVDVTSPYTGLTASGGVGVDFNPLSDRLRVVTAADEDLRVNPTTGLVITDLALNPGTPEVVGAAYTNSCGGATTTTLYDIDLASNSLVFQNPPNNGTLTPVGATLGIAPDSAQDLGLDISPAGNAAYLVARVAGVTKLYTVNLATGQATAVGNVGDGATPIRGFAVANNVVRPSADVVVREDAGTATGRAIATPTASPTRPTPARTSPTRPRPTRITTASGAPATSASQTRASRCSSPRRRRSSAPSCAGAACACASAAARRAPSPHGSSPARRSPRPAAPGSRRSAPARCSSSPRRRGSPRSDGASA
jgi:Domain of unknown function (DUF4394)